jgi:predicted extracellular nuclease
VPLIIVGDYNAYEFTDGYADVTGQIKGTAVQADNLEWEAPVTTPTLYDAGLTTDPATRYSFAFDGYVQELDHALLTSAAWADFVSLHNAHGNADTSEAGPEVTDPSTPARSADHDGQVLTLAIDRIFANNFEDQPYMQGAPCDSGCEDKSPGGK